jgi:hypothetical protein
VQQEIARIVIDAIQWMIANVRFGFTSGPSQSYQLKGRYRAHTGESATIFEKIKI